MKFKDRTMTFDKLLCAISISAILVMLIMLFTGGRIKAMEQKQGERKGVTAADSALSGIGHGNCFDPSIPLEMELQNHLRKCSAENGVPLSLALAVMEKESGFIIDADGGDSVGLMQINLCHGPREIIINPEENIRIGCWLLGYLNREYRNWEMALIAYNCGETGAEIMYFSKGIYRTDYSEDVIGKWNRWKEKLAQ